MRVLVSLASFCLFSSCVFAGSPHFVPSEGLCEIGSTSRVPSAWTFMTQAAFQENFGLSCSFTETAIAKPFEEVARRPGSLVFWVWIDRDERSEEFILRAFDRSTLYQFGVRRLHFAQTTELTSRRILDEALLSLMASYPFVGMIEQNQFWSWASDETLDVSLAAREKVVRHPFLPQVLEFKYKVKGSPRAVATVTGAANQRKWVPKSDFVVSRERQWLVRPLRP